MLILLLLEDIRVRKDMFIDDSIFLKEFGVFSIFVIFWKVLVFRDFEVKNIVILILVFVML